MRGRRCVPPAPGLSPRRGSGSPRRASSAAILKSQASGLEGATEWLCAQHDDMRGILWMLGTLSPATDGGRYQAELAELQAAFDAHAADEEKRMYPVFEKMLRK